MVYLPSRNNNKLLFRICVSFAELFIELFPKDLNLI